MYFYINNTQFQQWNGGSSCNNMTRDTYYCVANFTALTLPRPPTVSTLPSPVQPGIISSCVSWYQAERENDCGIIPQLFRTFGEAEFLSWNPAIGGPNCSGLVVGDYYCVAIPSTPTVPLVDLGTPTDCFSYWFVSE